MSVMKLRKKILIKITCFAYVLTFWFKHSVSSIFLLQFTKSSNHLALKSSLYKWSINTLYKEKLKSWLKRSLTWWKIGTRREVKWISFKFSSKILIYPWCKNLCFWSFVSRNLFTSRWFTFVSNMETL